MQARPSSDRHERPCIVRRTARESLFSRTRDAVPIISSKIARADRQATNPATATGPIELGDIRRQRASVDHSTEPHDPVVRGAGREGISRGPWRPSGSGSKLIGKLHRVSLRCSLLACRLPPVNLDRPDVDRPLAAASCRQHAACLELAPLLRCFERRGCCPVPKVTEWALHLALFFFERTPSSHVGVWANDELQVRFQWHHWELS
jgi:hypothetical protein